MKVAILGGTYSPPHNGHLFLAQEVKEAFSYDKIIFIPSFIPAHKTINSAVTPEDRLAMLKLAVADVPWAEVSDCEIARGGVTRSIDTIYQIREQYGLSEKPGFIIGDDLASGFSRWKNPEEICLQAELIIAVRGDDSLQDFPYAHKTVQNRPFPLSSSEIRERVHRGSGIRFLVPDRVYEYIIQKELYR